MGFLGKENDQGAFPFWSILTLRDAEGYPLAKLGFDRFLQFIREEVPFQIFPIFPDILSGDCSRAMPAKASIVKEACELIGCWFTFHGSSSLP